MGHTTKLSRKPLEDVLFFITAAQQIMLRLSSDASYKPDEYDFTLLHKISGLCDNSRLLAAHTEMSLHQRHKGLPETPLLAEFSQEN